MNSEALNPMSVIPPPPSEGGAAVAASAIQPQNPIVPTFAMPKDGSKPEDKKFQDDRQKSAQEYKEIEEQEQQQRFTALSDLSLRPSFADMFYALYKGTVSSIDSLQRKALSEAGISANGTFSNFINQNPEQGLKRYQSYDKVIFYHETVPGTRFRGQM
jgi:hypothetical protein